MKDYGRLNENSYYIEKYVIWIIRLIKFNKNDIHYMKY